MQGSMDAIKVLCVDDEPEVLVGLKLNLRRGFHVETATNAVEALKKLGELGPFAVVVSDMRMPGVDGATFLSHVRERYPDITRIVLTGYADVNAAVAAVNDGQIYRFLTKPCTPANFVRAVAEAAEIYALRHAERTLLERTLHGSISALCEVLSLVNPVAFGRATRIRKLSSDLLKRLGVRERWPAELAALLSQVAYVTLPEATASKVYFGQALDPGEQESVDRLPQIAADILGNIPRLEPVIAVIRRARDPKPAAPINMCISAIDVASAFDVLEAQGRQPSLAVDELRLAKKYDKAMLDVLAALVGELSDGPKPRLMHLRDVRTGMTFADDVRTTAGLVLVARGFVVNDAFIERIRLFRSDLVEDLVKVFDVGRESEKEAA